jgi:hypothetical protein
MEVFGQEIDSSLNWKSHTKLNFTKIMHKFHNKVPQIYRWSKTIQTMYFYFHLIMVYDTFLGRAFGSNKVFLLQRKAIRIMTNAQKRGSCKTLCKKSINYF